MLTHQQHHSVVCPWNVDQIKKKTTQNDKLEFVTQQDVETLPRVMLRRT